MEANEKQKIKLRLGITIQKIIAENKKIATSKKEKGIGIHGIVNSLRKLAAASGVEFSTIQKIAAGEKNAEFTTVIAILDGLSINWSQFGDYYNSISEKEILQYKDSVEVARRERLKKKVAKKGKKK